MDGRIHGTERQSNFRLWLRVLNNSRGPEFLKQRFKIRGEVESMLLQAQPPGTSVAQNPSGFFPDGGLSQPDMSLRVTLRYGSIEPRSAKASCGSG
jgi:hypothetical protein